MIWDSHPWKKDLRAYAMHLHAKTQQQKWRNATSIAVEKTVFLGFYTVRKLIEAGKVSSDIPKLRVPCLLFKPMGRAVTKLNWHRIDELFQMSSPTKDNIELRPLANQVIHSFVFQLGFEESGEFNHILLCSDRQRSKGLYKISTKNVIRVFKLIGSDFPSDGRLSFNSSKNDYDFKTYRQRTPNNPLDRSQRR